MFVYKKLVVQQENVSQVLFSKVLLEAQDWEGQAGTRRGLGENTEPRKTKA
jgi:hypothetical protein